MDHYPLFDKEYLILKKNKLNDQFENHLNWAFQVVNNIQNNSKQVNEVPLSFYPIAKNIRFVSSYMVLNLLNNKKSIIKNLIRSGEVIETLDVYDLLIDGNYNLKKRLRSGDVIFVEARKSVITIDGAVFRPAKYEVNEGQNLNSVIDYANGIKRTADLQNVSLERILDGTLKTIPVVNTSQFESIEALDGDLIYILRN